MKQMLKDAWGQGCMVTLSYSLAMLSLLIVTILAGVNLLDLYNSTGNMLDETIEHFTLAMVVVGIVSMGVFQYLRTGPNQGFKGSGKATIIWFTLLMIMGLFFANILEELAKPPNTESVALEQELRKLGVGMGDFEAADKDYTGSLRDWESLEKFQEQVTQTEDNIKNLKSYVEMEKLPDDVSKISALFSDDIRLTVPTEEHFNEIKLKTELDTFDTFVNEELGKLERLEEKVNKAQVRFSTDALKEKYEIDISTLDLTDLKAGNTLAKDVPKSVTTLTNNMEELTDALHKLSDPEVKYDPIDKLKHSDFTEANRPKLVSLDEKVQTASETLKALRSNLTTIDVDKSAEMLKGVRALRLNYHNFNIELDQLRDNLYDLDDLKVDLKSQLTHSEEYLSDLKEIQNKVKALEAARKVELQRTNGALIADDEGLHAHTENKSTGRTVGAGCLVGLAAAAYYRKGIQNYFWPPADAAADVNEAGDGQNGADNHDDRRRLLKTITDHTSHAHKRANSAEAVLPRIF